jgi:hypothetical protein
MLEKEIEAKTIKYAKSKNILNFKMNSATSRGLPDRLFISKKDMFFIEFKRKGRKPSKLQSHLIAQLRDYCCKVYIVDSLEEGMEIIDNISTLK